MSNQKARRKSIGMFSLVSTAKTKSASYVKNPTSYIELAIQEVGIPLTVKLLDENNEEELSQHDILTIHQQYNITQLECTKPNGETVKVPSTLPCRVNYIAIDKSKIYHTVNNVFENRVEDKITWIVVTKPFVCQGYVYSPGLIFEVLHEETNSEDDALAVEVHPGRLQVYLPLQIRGEFRKCNSPYFECECELSSLQNEVAPFFITPNKTDVHKLYAQEIEVPQERLFITDKTEDCYLIASSYSKTKQFYVHTFPVDFQLTCEILLGGIPVDILSEEELFLIQKELVLNSHTNRKRFLSLKYDDVGITRKKSKLNGKLKKKDIHAPKKLENKDFKRYIETPTSILKELNLNIANLRNEFEEKDDTSSNDAISTETSTVKRAKPRERKSLDYRSSSIRFERFSVADVLELLYQLSLEDYHQIFRNEQINGKLLTNFDENDFIELGMERSEAEQLYFFVNGLV